MYKENQSDGPGVTLNDAATVNPTFTAPTTSTQYWYNCYNDSLKLVTDRIKGLKSGKENVEVKEVTQITNEEWPSLFQLWEKKSSWKLRSKGLWMKNYVKLLFCYFNRIILFSSKYLSFFVSAPSLKQYDWLQYTTSQGQNNDS